jgi:hypothetical protein
VDDPGVSCGFHLAKIGDVGCDRSTTSGLIATVRDWRRRFMRPFYPQSGHCCE